MLYPTRAILIIALLEFAAAGCIHAQEVSYTGSMQYATGSYFFGETTQSFYMTNGLQVSGKRARLSVNVPYIIQNTPWISYSGGGYLPTGGTQHGTVGSGGSGGGGMGRMGRRIDLPDTSSYTKASFSDPSIHVGYYLLKGTYTTIVANASLKLPLADPEAGFGTGAWDLGAGLSVSRRLGSFFLMADAMYWWLGDMDDLDLKDPISFSAGVGRSFRAGKWLVIGSLNGYTRVIEETDPPLNLNIGSGWFVSEQVSINATAAFGLSESSPDFSMGMGWMVKL